MKKLEIDTLSILTDNYLFVIHDPHSLQTAMVDPGEPTEALTFLNKKGWNLNTILITHHHPDHIGGVKTLREKTNCKVFSSQLDQIMTKSDFATQQGDQHMLGKIPYQVLALPGHTRGHIAYLFPQALFCGDTLFSLGCGRIFEGTAEEMFASLNKIKALPKETQIFCAHEYTLANAHFALTVEPGNCELIKRMNDVTIARQKQHATIPTSLELELKTNPFLRTHSPEIRKNLNLESASELEVFTALRKLKDQFTTP